MLSTTNYLLVRSNAPSLVGRHRRRRAPLALLWSAAGNEPVPELRCKRPGHIAPPCTRIGDNCGTVL